MKLRIQNKLRELRQQKGNTQEELASFLGISAQSVSKWERGEGYPDITLLPQIAGYYYVSVDELLGVDEIEKQRREKEITKEYNTIRRHTPIDKNYRLDEGIACIRQGLKELPGNFFLEQLLAADLSWKGRSVSDPAEKQRIFTEVISLCDDILSRSTEDRWRYSASVTLMATYAEMGMTERALSLAYQLPGPFTTCEYMLTYILSGDELLSQMKTNAALYYSVFRESVKKLYLEGLIPENMVNPRELSVRGISKDEYVNAIRNTCENMSSTPG